VEGIDVDGIARVCHEANRAYCQALGDHTQVPWDDAPEWQRDSARVGVLKAIEGATSEQLHESWMAQKVADGWTHGAVKDADAKTHPCMVSYHELPPAQRRKDALFGAVVAALKG
jgi:hypothetical protein